nr:helix-turn-helix domain-containing protein [Colwellia sp. TT2012]
MTYEERCQIYALNKSDMSQKRIAIQLNVSDATIYQHIWRDKQRGG